MLTVHHDWPMGHAHGHGRMGSTYDGTWSWKDWWHPRQEDANRTSRMPRSLLSLSLIMSHTPYYANFASPWDDCARLPAVAGTAVIWLADSAAITAAAAMAAADDVPEEPGV